MRVVKGDQIREVLGEKELAVGVEMRAGGGGAAESVLACACRL